MMLSYMLAVLTGLGIGALVNWLAARLPSVAAIPESSPQKVHEWVAPKDKLSRRQHALAVRQGKVRNQRLSMFHLSTARQRHVFVTRARLRRRRSPAVAAPLIRARHTTWLRILAVEIILAMLTAYLWQREGFTLKFGIYLFYMSLFVLIAVIDIEHRLVLNIVMLPAFVVGAFEVLLSRRIPFLDAMAGFAIAQLVLLAFFGLGEVYLWIVNAGRKEPVTEVALGGGDVTLATFCGMVVGFPGVVLMLFLMVVFGAALALLYLAYRVVVVRKYQAHTALPYGPAILLAATLLLLWGPAVARFFGAE